MRVGRLLRSTEGVGAESHRVAGVALGGRFEESRVCGVAAYRAGKQAGRRRRGASGAGTLHACGYDETMVAWQGHRAGRCGAGRRSAGRRDAGKRGAGSRGAGRRGVGRCGARHGGP
eukprot:scaffold89484_cov65-Phaeocystis_antarctica.AAC.3